MKWKKEKSNSGDDPAAIKDESAKVEEGPVNAGDTPADAPDATGSSNRRDYKPARRFLHNLFILIAFLTILCALWMIGVQVMGFVVYENGYVDYVLRAYIILFSILVVFVEIEWPAFAREASLLHYWIPRGLIYVFIGVLGLQENESVVKEGYENYAAILEVAKVGAYSMIACGLLYFVMGALCLQLVLKHMRKSYQDKRAQYKGLDRSERQEKQEAIGKDNEDVEAAFEGVEVPFGEEKDDEDDVKAKDKEKVDSTGGRESDVEEAQGKSTTESLGEEKEDGSDWWKGKDDKQEIDSTERESGVEEAQDKSKADSEKKSASTIDEKERSDDKPSA